MGIETFMKNSRLIHEQLRDLADEIYNMAIAKSAHTDNPNFNNLIAKHKNLQISTKIYKRNILILNLSKNINYSNM